MRKKLWILGGLVGALYFLSAWPCAASVFDLWTASHTVTSDSATVIYGKGCVLNSICINRKGSTGSQLTVYNSSWTSDTNNGTGNGSTSTVIAQIDASAKDSCSQYNTFLSRGLVYTSSGTTPADVTILWSVLSH